MLKRRTVIQASLAGGLIAGLAGFSEVGHWYKAWMAEFGPGWKSMPWPFPRDAWPTGKAWRNRGLELEVYVRLKLGFCGNCDTGVVEDSEVDRVTDIDLLDPQFVPVQAGNRIRITDLVGRARLYRLKTRDGPRLAEAIAVSYKCDLVVAIVVGPVDDSKTLKAAHNFLETNTVQVWVNELLEGR
ncbi:MAG: hypothetical protein U1E60_22005 [Reyranellaceae bacterium]